MSSDSKLFSVIWNYLKNNTLMGTDNYPNAPTAAYGILCQYKNLTSPSQTHAPPGGVAFFQHENTGSKKVPGNYERLFSDATCYLYHKMGQYAVN